MNHIEAFEKIIEEQLARVERLKAEEGYLDYSALPKVVIGLIAGDGIGPVIVGEARRVLEKILAKEIAQGKIELRTIEGLTIENRIEKMQAVPQDVLAAIKDCHVLLKGPTTTPAKGDGMPNLESANVALRRELDLFANVRPVTIPEEGVNWVFYRENTEGEYVLGSRGVDISEDMAIDFKVTTNQGTRRIAKAAFEYAKANGNLGVSVVTKANIMKKTDGKFSAICKEVAAEYPDIKTEEWFVDIMAAKLVDPGSRKNFHVFVLPNLYGDIITDEAAQLQGGVGTAGSANVGSRYAMFEAIHGSAPRMIQRGMGEYANPASIIKASEMMLRHLGYGTKADQLQKALDKASEDLSMSGNGKRDTAAAFADYIIKIMGE